MSAVCSMNKGQDDMIVIHKQTHHDPISRVYKLFVVEDFNAIKVKIFSIGVDISWRNVDGAIPSCGLQLRTRPQVTYLANVCVFQLLPRERKMQEYQDAVVDRYEYLPEIKRIVRHRHLPKPVYKEADNHRCWEGKSR
ncbi:hypothetical protein EJ110_NYTH22220 [Nymphaea thermarum]|nr:hypothetical protein EJ110_NYTH22220 [Nymphaea thermarum]